MLIVNSGMPFNVQAVNFAGATTALTENDTIILIKDGGGGSTVTGLALSIPQTHTFGTNQYEFILSWAGTDLLLTITVDPTISSGGGGTLTITPIQNNNNNNIGVIDTGLGSCVDPIINSISADPILGGAKLSVETWSGDGCVLSYQWQVEQAGGWINIPSATGPDYYYAGLPAGTYTVRCIVKNAAGEMISAPVTFTVS